MSQLNDQERFLNPLFDIVLASAAANKGALYIRDADGRDYRAVTDRNLNLGPEQRRVPQGSVLGCALVHSEASVHLLGQQKNISSFLEAVGCNMLLSLSGEAGLLGWIVVKAPAGGRFDHRTLSPVCFLASELLQQSFRFAKLKAGNGRLSRIISRDGKASLVVDAKGCMHLMGESETPVGARGRIEGSPYTVLRSPGLKAAIHSAREGRACPFVCQDMTPTESPLEGAAYPFEDGAVLVEFSRSPTRTNTAQRAAAGSWARLAAAALLREKEAACEKAIAGSQRVALFRLAEAHLNMALEERPWLRDFSRALQAVPGLEVDLKPLGPDVLESVCLRGEDIAALAMIAAASLSGEAAFTPDARLTLRIMEDTSGRRLLMDITTASPLSAEDEVLIELAQGLGAPGFVLGRARFGMRAEADCVPCGARSFGPVLETAIISPRLSHVRRDLYCVR